MDRVQALLRIPEQLRRYCGEQTAIELAGEDVGALLRDLAGRYPELASRVLDEAARLRPHLVVIRNDQILPREGLAKTPVSGEDDLRIFTAVSGG